MCVCVCVTDLKIDQTDTASLPLILSLTHLAFKHLFFDELPDDPGHLISVHLHHRLCHLDTFIGICQIKPKQSFYESKL